MSNKNKNENKENEVKIELKQEAKDIINFLEKGGKYFIFIGENDQFLMTRVNGFDEANILGHLEILKAEVLYNVVKKAKLRNIPMGIL